MIFVGDNTRKVTIDKPSTGIFKVPFGVNTLFLTMVAGGGGGGIDSGAVNSYSGGGGASVIRFPISVTEGQEVSYTVGAGGTPNLASATAMAGGDTIFGTIICQGGKTYWGASGGTSAGGISPQSSLLNGESAPAGFATGGSSFFKKGTTGAGSFGAGGFKKLKGGDGFILIEW